jgi:hypothetical protein
MKNGEEHIYTSLYNTLLEELQMSNNTLTNALKQLKKFEYIFIKENEMREVVIKGRGSFPRHWRKGSPPRDLRASFEIQKAGATTHGAKPSQNGD